MQSFPCKQYSFLGDIARVGCAEERRASDSITPFMMRFASSAHPMGSFLGVVKFKNWRIEYDAIAYTPYATLPLS